MKPMSGATGISRPRLGSSWRAGPACGRTGFRRYDWPGFVLLPSTRAMISMKGKTSPVVDVAVVGAGPAGCLCALSLANRGAHVLLLEASREPPQRLAGEWLHPPAVEILARWDLSLPESCSSPGARGFVVFPHNGSSPIELPYAAGNSGAVCEHGPLVAALRKRAREDPRIRILEGARVTAISGQTLSYAQDGGPESHVTVRLIVGADGRSSAVRRQSNLPDRRVEISSMAGL